MTERDSAILYCITTFGPLTREQLMELAKKEKRLKAPITLWRRLLQDKPLVAGKYIYVWESPFGGKWVYACYDITKRKDFNHDLITTWVHILLYLYFDLVKFDRTKQKLSGQINEDAYLGLALPGAVVDGRLGRVYYYLESDTGSVSYWQVENKWERYVKLLEEADKAFFVLFVCSTKERAFDLMVRARKAIPQEHRHLFLFTYLDAFRENPTGRICYTPSKPNCETEQDLFTILPPA